MRNRNKLPIVVATVAAIVSLSSACSPNGAATTGSQSVSAQSPARTVDVRSPGTTSAPEKEADGIAAGSVDSCCD